MWCLLYSYTYVNNKDYRLNLLCKFMYKIVILIYLYIINFETNIIRSQPLPAAIISGVSLKFGAKGYVLLFLLLTIFIFIIKNIVKHWFTFY